MNIKNITLTFLGLCFAASSFAQYGFQMKLKHMPEDLTWGVYVLTEDSSPSQSVVTASGQATLVMPLDFEWSDPVNYNGKWQANAVVESPEESPDLKYVSFGLLQAEPNYPIPYHVEEDILLFTFKGSHCPDSIYLIDCNTPNVTDPFCPDFMDDTPWVNSASSNPGQDLTVLDMGNGFNLYSVNNILAPSSWSCDDCDGDGIVNGLEDTNGDGAFTLGVDVSNLCGGCEEALPETANLSGGATICAGESAAISVDITGGNGPFTVVLSDGSSEISIVDYESGAAIMLSPEVTSSYSILSVAISELCVLEENFSGSADITVTNALSIGTQPAGVSACAGDEVAFSASVINGSGASAYYLWQKSCDGGNTWNDLGDADSSTETNINGLLTLSEISTDDDGCAYRFRAWTESCGNANSSAAAVEVQSAPQILEQPVAQSACEGTAAYFETAPLAVPGLGLQWEQSCDGGTTWQEISESDARFGGVKSATLTVHETTEELVQCAFRLVASVENCGSTASETATLSIRQAPVIMEQPSGQTACVGETLLFSATAAANIDAVQYQWQQSCDGGASWSDITVFDPNFENSLTPNLTVKSVEAGLAGCQFRMKAWANDCGDTYSDAAAIEVSETPSITSGPVSMFACEGEIAQFESSVSAGIDGAEYQWQISCDGGLVWDDLGADDAVFANANTTSLTVLETAPFLSNCRFRMKVQSGGCAPVYSGQAQIIVEQALAFSDMPTDKTVCPGSEVKLAASTTLGGIAEYQWQMSTNGLDFFDIEEAGTAGFDGWDSPELIVANADAVAGYRFRLAARTAICTNMIYSDAAKVSVAKAISVATSPEAITACQDEEISLFASIDMAGQTNVNLQWQYLADGAFDWQNLADAAPYYGVQSEELTIGSEFDANGLAFRLQATGECATVATEVALIATEDCSIDSHFVDLKIEWRPDIDRWAVYARPANGFVPHTYQEALSGRVIIAASAGFAFHNLVSVSGGTWKAGTVVLETAQAPDYRYFTFDLSPSGNQLDLHPDYDIPLFTFQTVQECPKTLYIMEGEVPDGMLPTEFSGVDLLDQQFFFGKTYDLDAWNCHGGSQALMANPNGAGAISPSQGTDGGLASQNTENQPVVDLGFASQNTASTFRLSPNPATDWVKVNLGAVNENARLHLINLQGQTVRTIHLEAQTEVRMELSLLPTGIYFVALEEAGVVVQREKLVVR